MTAVGNANVVIVTGTGMNVAGTANITGNLTTGTGSGGNITGANVISANTGTFSANVTAGNLIGVFANGNSNVSIPSANGNVNISATGNANIVVVTGTGLAVTGTLSATGTLSGGTSGTGYSFDGSAPAGSLSLISGGRFGIGMSLPTSKLTIGNDSFTVAASNTTGMYTGANGLIVLSDGLFIATRAGVDRVVLDTSGNLGIGTSSPLGRLDVAFSGAGYSRVRSTSATTAGTLFQNSTTGTGDNNGLFVGVDGTSSAYFYNYSNAALVFGVNATERMRLDSSGNLGIGTSSPTVKLDVLGAARIATSTGSGGLDIGTASGQAQYQYINFGGNSGGVDYAWQVGRSPSGGVGPADGFYFYDIKANATRLSIDTSGNLLVGATSASAPASGFVLLPNYSETDAAGIYIAHKSGSSSGDVYAAFAYASAAIGSITQSGTTAVLYNTTSDLRLKENIQNSAPASALIDNLQVRQYDWKSDGSHQRYGFVAQEIVTVVPEAVYQPINPEEMMAVDYSKLVPMLVKEIQDLRKRLAAAGIA